jgi:hypothetical protein
MYRYEYSELIREHLVRSGFFIDNYFICTKHSDTQLKTQNIIDERIEENIRVPNSTTQDRKNWPYNLNALLIRLVQLYSSTIYRSLIV